MAKQQADQIGAAIRYKDPDGLLELFTTGRLSRETSSALAGTAAGHSPGDPPEAPACPGAGATQQKGALRRARRVLGALYEAGERDILSGLHAPAAAFEEQAFARDPQDLRRILEAAFGAVEGRLHHRFFHQFDGLRFQHVRGAEGGKGRRNAATPAQPSMLAALKATKISLS